MELSADEVDALGALDALDFGSMSPVPTGRRPQVGQSVQFGMGEAVQAAVVLAVHEPVRFDVVVDGELRKRSTWACDLAVYMLTSAPASSQTHWTPPAPAVSLQLTEWVPDANWSPSAYGWRFVDG